ncbi:MAG: hypothetical protein SGARI_007796 [Bacillariaceae sp.]
MKFIIKEEVHRSNQMESTIDALQARVLDMQQQELAMLEKDLKDRKSSQDHMVELQALVDRQAKEIQQFHSNSKGEVVVVDEKDVFQDVQGLVEENKALREELDQLADKHAKKEETIAFLMKEIEKLKMTRSPPQPERKTSLSTQSVESKDDTKTIPAVKLVAPSSPKESVMAKLQILMQPPSAPKSAKKEKVAIQGMDMAAFSTPF